MQREGYDAVVLTVWNCGKILRIPFGIAMFARSGTGKDGPSVHRLPPTLILQAFRILSAPFYSAATCQVRDLKAYNDSPFINKRSDAAGVERCVCTDSCASNIHLNTGSY
jgi:hypothetical protein